MKNYYDVIIAGGGASGIFCAINVKKHNPSLSVLILEKQQRIGKKLLATGNGRCNLTNLNIDDSMYHGSFKTGASKLLGEYSTKTIIGMFEEMGLYTTSDEAGRVYPLSKQASTVLDVLRINLRKYGVDVLTECEITGFHKNKGLYSVRTPENSFTSRYLVIATGSKATPSLGSDSKMLSLAQKAGHSTKALSPALCPINVKSNSLKALKGVRVTGKVTLMSGERILKEEYGEIQFTENALSGICIFNLSGLANIKEDTSISISLLPQLSEDEIADILKKKRELLPADSSNEELFCGLFHKMIGIALLKECSLSPSDRAKDITDDSIKSLAHTINNWTFKAIPSDDFSKAQVASGGIYGKEIDWGSMESRLVKGLFFIGEIIDIYGDCGGLNLHFAFMSAAQAAKRICEIC